jgi:potassium efflux system protein
MHKVLKSLSLFLILIITLSVTNSFAQVKSKRKSSIKREAERRAMHSRDSLLKSISKSDTSINSLLQRIEQYTTAFNQIKNSLADGLDTADISQQLPPIVKRLDKVITLGNTHKSSTLRYLFVLRDNLDHMQGDLDDFQSDLADLGTKLVQNQSDLLKFTKDSLLIKTVPSDSVTRETFFADRKALRKLWAQVDITNRTALLKLNLLQDKISVSYTKILDESDHIDSKIKGFAVKAISGESDYIWNADPQYNDFKSALNSTIRLNNILLYYFSKSEIATHLVGALYLVLIFIWILYSRYKAMHTCEDIASVFSQADYIYRKPLVSALIVVTAVVPYFYDHPPAAFLEIFFLISMILALILLKKDFPQATYKFFIFLFSISLIYCISNLFISISNIDRYVIFLLSALSIWAGYRFYKRYKQSPDDQIAYTGIALKIFVSLQVISLLLNITGRFSLAKIIGITAVFNLWLLVILYLVVNIIIQALYLQFQLKKQGNSFINWIDYTIVEKKFRTTLTIIAGILWLFFLLQNLNIDDWAISYATDVLNEPQTIAGASFTFGGFVIFIFVIWLSSIVSKIISYFYEVSAQRVTDLSVAKKKNRTSTLLIKMAVFSIGFLLAVAASGFPLEKLTIIISAFGVGIGFGLQNIVNNLVSGLILAFEKPINIGDTIEVDGVNGVMKEIGIRSSKIVTGDGSEVIMPNGDLISHHVINWTLSNTNRQVNLILHTAYGIDIDKVRQLLVDLFSNREDVMSEPAPLVFINSITESFVEFKVLFWAADLNKTGSLKSNILADVYKMFNAEGVKMPETQKDFYLHFPDGDPFINKKEETPKVEKLETKPKETPTDQAQ